MPDREIYIERGLLLRIADGDEAAFTELFHTYLGKLKPFVDKLCPPTIDTEEIIQETFIRLWFNRDKLPDITNLSAYIFKVAANQYRLAIRKSLSADKTLQKYTQAVGNPIDTGVDQAVRYNELKRLVQEAIDLLPPKRKRIFQMSREEGMTIPQIASALGVSPKTVKNSLFAALVSIRQYLAKVGEILVYWMIFRG